MKPITPFENSLHDVTATCPLCKTANAYGVELIGRYTICTTCRGRFYIEVPPLGASDNKLPPPSEPLASTCAPPSTTLDDLLRDTQQGNRYVIHALWRMESRLKWQSYGTIAVVALVLLELVLLIAAA